MSRESLEAADRSEVGSPESLYRRIERRDPVTILDVRPGDQFDEWRISGPSVSNVNVPAFDIIDDDTQTVLDRLPEADELVVVCAAGKSSALLAGWLTSHGYDATNLQGGMEGWARVLVSKPISGYDGPGTLLQYQRPSSGCLGYLLHHDGEAAIVDPLRVFTDRYLEDVADLDCSLQYAIDTHVHADHVSGVRELAAAGSIGVMPAPAIDRGVTYADEITTISDGETLTVGAATVEAVHTPGHTSGMTSYRIGDSVLLTGDTLFTDSVARPDLEAGNEGAREAAGQLYDTLQSRIDPLPDDIVIAGGHQNESAASAADGTATVRLGDLEKRLSIFDLDRESFVDLLLSDMPPRPANFRRIIAANLGQEEIDAEEAFELELGPNNCASSRGGLG